MEAVAESGRGSTTWVAAAGGGERASLVTCYGENWSSVTLMIWMMAVDLMGFTAKEGGSGIYAQKSSGGSYSTAA